MRALCWMGVNDLQVNTVPDPRIVNPHDVVLKVRLTTTCGSDLHLIDGYIPTMREGDVIGHEYMGEIADVAPRQRSSKSAHSSCSQYQHVPQPRKAALVAIVVLPLVILVPSNRPCLRSGIGHSSAASAPEGRVRWLAEEGRERQCLPRAMQPAKPSRRGQAITFAAGSAGSPSTNGSDHASRADAHRSGAVARGERRDHLGQPLREAAGEPMLPRDVAIAGPVRVADDLAVVGNRTVAARPRRGAHASGRRVMTSPPNTSMTPRARKPRSHSMGPPRSSRT
jgi:hypothetical protein